MAPRKTIAGLQAQLETATRQLGAHREWFYLSTSPDVHADDAECIVETGVIDSTPTVRVRVRGLSRFSGGVCVVDGIGENFSRGEPMYVWELICTWNHSESPYLREAARKLAKMSDAGCTA